MLFLSPGAALTASQHLRNRDPDIGVNNLLESFTMSMDSGELYLLLVAMVLAVSIAFMVVSSILYFVLPDSHHASAKMTNVWFYMMVCSTTSCMVSLVVLIEPRPMHWLPSIESITSSMGRCSPSEWKLRIRRWWRWRTKYAARTKLNV